MRKRKRTAGRGAYATGRRAARRLAPARAQPLAPFPTQTTPRSSQRPLIAFCAAAGLAQACLPANLT